MGRRPRRARRTSSRPTFRTFARRSHRIACSPGRPGYALEVEADELDLRRFERETAAGRRLLSEGDAENALGHLDEALSLWRGPPLGGVGDAPFAAIEVARLEELRLAALEDRFDAILALGRQGQAISEIEALVGQQPLRERPRAQLMLALYRSGRQSEALSVYRDARALLVDELGIEPGQALRDLNAAIAQDRELDPPGETGTARAARTVSSSASRSKTWMRCSRSPARSRIGLPTTWFSSCWSPTRTSSAGRRRRQTSEPLAKAGLGGVASPRRRGCGHRAPRRGPEVSLLLVDAVGQPDPDGRFDPLLGLLASVPCDVGLLVRSEG